MQKQERETRITKLWQQGLPMTQISKDVDMSICAVRRVLLQAGYSECSSHSEGAKRHYAVEADKKWDDIYSDIVSGKKLSEIQNAYGMTKVRLLDLFCRHDFDYDAYVIKRQELEDQELKKTLIDLRNQGKSVKDICMILNKSESTIGRYLLKFGLSKKADRIDISDVDILDYWNQGFSMIMIAKKLNCSTDTISNRLKKAGISIDKAKGIERHFDFVHESDWEDIKADLDRCISVFEIGMKYHLRIPIIYRMMEQHNYQYHGFSSVDLDKLHDRMKNCITPDEMLYLQAIEDYVQKTGNAPVIYTLSRFMNLDANTVKQNFIKYDLFCFCGNNNVSVKALRVMRDLDDLGIDYEINNRKILKSESGTCLEMDIYLSDYQLGIEINPTFTHSCDIYPFGKKSHGYHQSKSICAENANVGLIHLYDSDFINENSYQVFLTQMRFMSQDKIKIGARKCDVCQINRQQSNDFLNKYHFQCGEKSSQLLYGMFYQGNLIGVLTIGYPRYAKADYEIIRYCMHPGYIIIGSFAKLFSNFLNTLNSDADILSYMDLNKRMRPSCVYEKNGFHYAGITPPDYVWYNQSGTKMKSRYSVMKKTLVAQGYDASKSEIQIMNELGFVRVFGSGSKKFIYHHVCKTT